MSNASDIGIYQLKINIRSSIPNQDKLVLTSDMLNYTGGASLEKYPFFSAVHTYPRRKLQGKSYNEIVEFFFILSNFRTKLRKQNITRRDKTNIPQNKTQNAKQGGLAKQGRAKEKTPQEKLFLKQSNFILMLQLLFPTVYPIINNIDTSIGIISEQTDELETKDEKADEKEETNLEESEVFDDVKKPETNTNTENKQIANLTTSIFDFKNISSFFSLKGTSMFGLSEKFSKKFSYLKIGGQEYTITRTIWLNDVMNNPIYSDIIKTYQIFTIWKSSKQEIHDKKEKWNIVLLLFDYCVKLKSKSKSTDRLESMNLLDSYTRIEQNNIATFNNQVKTINDLLTSEYNGSFDFIAEDISKENDKYTEKRKIVFEIYKKDNETKLYDELEKLSNSYKQIQNQNVTNTYNTFLRDLNEKIKIYSQMKKYDAYVNNLNFEYLSEEKQKIDSSLVDAARNISTSYPEFNNFVSKIRDMKVRVIDNPVWKKVIESIIRGSKYHNFQTKIWKKIDGCYGLSEDYEEQMNDEDDSKDGLTDETKKMTGGGGCGMNEIVIQVNFDEIRDQDSSKMANMKLIDLYLQMDVIEGKIDENNVQLIKCDYTNTELGHTWDTLMNGNMSWDLSQIMTFYSAKKQLASGIASSTNTSTGTGNDTGPSPSTTDQP
jgi:hypothetical protein